MMTGILIGGLAAIALLVGLAIYAAYRAGREDGYEQGYGDARQEKLTEDRRQRAEKAGRHRMSQPRAAALPSQPAAGQPDPKPGPVTLPAGGAIGYMVARFAAAKPAVTVRDIDTVLLAPSPAPAKNGAADTGTLARVQLSDSPDTITGEMRAVTDAWIAENIHPETVL